VLFDFAGTLLVPVPATEWVREVTGALGRDLDEAAGAAADHDAGADHDAVGDLAAGVDLAARLEQAGRPGGPEPAHVPPELAADYARRDVSVQLHRSAYAGLLGSVTGPGSALTTALYDAGTQPSGWTPYPDAGPTLAALRDDGVRIAVVSNVGFDLRAVFAGHGLAGLVDEWVLSCELGVMKPAAEIFTAALRQLGVAAADALMVGDNPRADGGAVDVGIRTLVLPYSPARQPHGLAAVLDLVRGDAGRRPIPGGPPHPDA